MRPGRRLDPARHLLRDRNERPGGFSGLRRSAAEAVRRLSAPWALRVWNDRPLGPIQYTGGRSVVSLPWGGNSAVCKTDCTPNPNRSCCTALFPFATSTSDLGFRLWTSNGNKKGINACAPMPHISIGKTPNLVFSRHWSPCVSLCRTNNAPPFLTIWDFERLTPLWATDVFSSLRQGISRGEGGAAITH